MNEAPLSLLKIPVNGQLFQFGNVAIATRASASVYFNSKPVEAADALTRHANGDWGTVCRDDWDANDLALSECGRILSTYKATNQTVFWIITEWNRIATAILLPVITR